MTKLSGNGEACALFNCNYCQKDISNVVRIRCAECANVDLCAECFAVGVEPHPHKAYHQYHVIDNMSFPLFTRDWGADEELLLLEAVEMFGLGNWTEVSEHVGTKTRAQCHAHYFEVYVKSPCAPLPDMSKILGKGVARMTPDELKAEAEQKANENKDVEEEEKKLLESLANPNAVKTEGNVQELTGYNIKRNEFDPEYDMDAELPLAEMEFRENDTEEDVQMKLRMIEIYNSRLQERARRKQFILERNLLNVKKQQNVEKKWSQYERDLHGTMRVFARFLTSTEYDVLLEGLAAEHRIRTRITELKEYRRNGIHTVAEGEDYDLEKRRRETEFARLRAIEHPTSKNIARANKFIVRDATQINEQLTRMNDEDKTVSVIPTPRASTLGPRRRMYLSLDLADLPGVDLLNDDEKELCTSCRLLPVQYLSMKVELMREGLKSEKPLNRTHVRNMFKVDPLKAIRVYELLLQHGWVLEDGFVNADEDEDSEPAPKKSASADEEEDDEEDDEVDYETDDNDEDEDEEDDEEEDSEEED